MSKTQQRVDPVGPLEKQQNVIDVDIEGDQTLVSIERGSFSIAIQAPSYVGAEELEQALVEVPESFERVVDLFDFEDQEGEG